MNVIAVLFADGLELGAFGYVDQEQHLVDVVRVAMMDLALWRAVLSRTSVAIHLRAGIYALIHLDGLLAGAAVDLRELFEPLQPLGCGFADFLIAGLRPDGLALCSDVLRRNRRETYLSLSLGHDSLSLRCSRHKVPRRRS